MGATPSFLTTKLTLYTQMLCEGERIPSYFYSTEATNCFPFIIKISGVSLVRSALFSYPGVALWQKVLTNSKESDTLLGKTRDVLQQGKIEDT